MGESIHEQSKTFFLAFSVIAGLVVVPWFLLLIVYRKHISPLQWYVGVLWACVFFENLVWLSFLREADEIPLRKVGDPGERDMAISSLLHSPVFVLSIVSSVFREAGSRVLAVALSFGLGILRKSLTGQMKTRLFILGAVYWCVDFLIYDDMFFLAFSRSSMTEGSDGGAPMFQFIVRLVYAFVESVFLYCTMHNCLYSLHYLKRTGETEKHKVLTKVCWVFGLVIAVTIPVSIAVILWSGSGAESHKNELTWLEMLIPRMLYFAALLGISYVFLPSTSVAKYSYAQVGSNEGGDFHSVNGDTGLDAPDDDVAAHPLEDLSMGLLLKMADSDDESHDRRAAASSLMVMESDDDPEDGTGDVEMDSLLNESPLSSDTSGSEEV